MTQYTVLIPDDEAEWERASAEARAAVYAQHAEFARVLAERGHKVVAGAELAPSRTARTLRRDAAGTLTVTDGPYAEAAEQLSGYYVIESDDVEDLLEVCALITVPGGAVEVRAANDGDRAA